MRRLLSESRHNYLQHINGKTFAARHLHFQAWAYIYTAYAYVILVNYASVRRLTNMLEFFLTWWKLCDWCEFESDLRNELLFLMD